MRNERPLTCVLMVLLSLAGCAPHTWVAGPNANPADFSQARAQCSLMARHGGGGFYASGSTRFVVGAAIGNAIGEAIRTKADFDDCMQASGWLIADQAAMPPQVIVTTSSPAQAAAPIRLLSPSSEPTPTLTTSVPVVNASTKVQPARTWPTPTGDRIRLLLTNHVNCYRIARNSANYEVLLQHFPSVETGKYSVAQRADAGMATPAEGKLLSSYWDSTAPCRDEFVTQLGQTMPGAAETIRHHIATAATHEQQLIQNRISWGQWATVMEQDQDMVIQTLTDGRG